MNRHGLVAVSVHNAKREFEVEEMKSNSVEEEKDLGNAVVDREPSFTPGPWQCDLSTNVIAGRFTIRQHFNGTATLGELKANARLIAAAPSMCAFLMKIYLDYEGDCACECDSETCCAVVGQPCAKCHANIALLIMDRPIGADSPMPLNSEGSTKCLIN